MVAISKWFEHEWRRIEIRELEEYARMLLAMSQTLAGARRRA